MFFSAFHFFLRYHKTTIVTGIVYQMQQCNGIMKNVFGLSWKVGGHTKLEQIYPDSWVNLLKIEIYTDCVYTRFCKFI